MEVILLAYIDTYGKLNAIYIPADDIATHIINSLRELDRFKKNNLVFMPSNNSPFHESNMDITNDSRKAYFDVVKYIDNMKMHNKTSYFQAYLLDDPFNSYNQLKKETMYGSTPIKVVDSYLLYNYIDI